MVGCGHGHDHDHAHGQPEAGLARPRLYALACQKEIIRNTTRKNRSQPFCFKSRSASTLPATTSYLMSVSCTARMAMTPPEWRQLWRKRGLALDKILPYALAVPKPSDDVLRQRLPASLSVPGESRRLSLDDTDRTIALEAADFVSGFIAEELPAELLSTDLKLPSIASALAVQDVGDEGEWLGSFDFMLRIRASRCSSPWHKYHRHMGVVDFKLSGTSENIGLNSRFMRRHLTKGRLVLRAARKQKGSFVGPASFVAYLLRRPRGPVYSGRGRVHPGAWSFLAYNADALSNWDPDSRSTPRPFMHLGTLVVSGIAEESESLRVELPVFRGSQVDRWELLRGQSSNGWVSLGVFLDVFKLKYTGLPKHAMGRVKKRLVDAGCAIKKTDPPVGRGHPPPLARVCDLQRVYNDLH